MIKNLGKGEIYFWKVYIYLASIGISYIADFFVDPAAISFKV